MDSVAPSEASKPEEGDATMALVVIMEMVVPHAECACRMPTGDSGTTKCVTLALWAESKKTAFMVFNKRLAFTRPETTQLLLNSSMTFCLKLSSRK